MKKRIMSLLLTGALLGGLIGCGSKDTVAEDATEETAGTAVEVQEIVAGDIASSSRLSGKVIAAREVSVYPPIAAKVLSVSVQVGDTVTVGQTLFTLDKSDIQDQYQPLLDNYNRTKTMYDEQIRQLQKNVSDTKALLEIGAASQAELDAANLQLLQAQTNEDSTLSQIDQSMKDVRETLADTSVEATMTGIVSAVSVVAGATAAPGAPAVVISESQKPQILVSVSESIRPYIKAGDKAMVSISSIGRDDIVATVNTVAPATNVQTQLYEVRLDLPSGLDTQVGMFADVTFSTNAKNGVVLVPTEAILTDGEIEYCYIANDDNTVSRVEVTTGITSGDQTEVTSGLTAGQMLVTVGQSYLSDGAPIRIVEGA